MKISIFTHQTVKSLAILFVCLLTLGGFSDTAFANPTPISEGVDISAQVVSVGPVVPPTVMTDVLTTIGENTATLLGTLSDLGDSSVTIEGFDYGLTAGYGTTSTSTSGGGFGTGQFSANISGLVCNTQYHYRAFATNSAGTTNGTDVLFTTTACPIVPLPVPSPGTGGGAGHILTTTSTVNFSGFAYPGASVVVLRDGVTVANISAGSNGAFSSSLTGLDAGAYVFSLYAKDSLGGISAPSSFPFVLDGKSVVNITGILIAPTLNTDKVAVQKGDKLTISGYAVPNSPVSISSAQFSNTYTAQSDANGVYSYNLDVSNLAIGAYTLHARYSIGTNLSSISKGKMFLMGLTGTLPNPLLPGGIVREGDLNHDGKVDIVDYSIMRYWYKKDNPPESVDLSHDGIISLKDFSILASDWTG